MSDKKLTSNRTPLPTIITLTLPTPLDGGIPLERATATLLIQRGDLAHVRQFTYVIIEDMMTAIREAYIGLEAVEAKPPIIPELPKVASKLESTSRTKTQPKPDVIEEPTIDIPLKKGTLVVKISNLKIIGGETDAAAYRQAVLIAGKLIDGKLWDGQSPIRIDDVYTTMKKMKHLSESEMSLFTLEDFVQVGRVEDTASEIAEGDQLLLTTVPSTAGQMFSANGHHPNNAVTQ